MSIEKGNELFEHKKRTVMSVINTSCTRAQRLVQTIIPQI